MIVSGLLTDFICSSIDHPSLSVFRKSIIPRVDYLLSEVEDVYPFTLKLKYSFLTIPNTISPNTISPKLDTLYAMLVLYVFFVTPTEMFPHVA